MFEGRDRVGGRSLTGRVAGVPADMGGSFIGPTQDAVLALATELGIPTTPTHRDGRNVIQWRGSARSYRGTIPKLSLTGLIDIGRLRWQFERIARGVPVAAPGMRGARVNSTTCRSGSGCAWCAPHRPRGT